MRWGDIIYPHLCTHTHLYSRRHLCFSRNSPVLWSACHLHVWWSGAVWGFPALWHTEDHPPRRARPPLWPCQHVSTERVPPYTEMLVLSSFCASTYWFVSTGHMLRLLHTAHVITLWRVRNWTVFHCISSASLWWRTVVLRVELICTSKCVNIL